MWAINMEENKMEENLENMINVYREYITYLEDGNYQNINIETENIESLGELTVDQMYHITGFIREARDYLIQHEIYDGRVDIDEGYYEIGSLPAENERDNYEEAEKIVDELENLRTEYFRNIEENDSGN